MNIVPSRTFGAAALLLVCSSVAFAEDELKTLLHMPLTPGALALLARHTNESAAITRIKAALDDPSGPVRAVSARLVELGAILELVPGLQSQLARETDPDAAREQIRALCSLGGPAYDTAILEAAARFGHRLDSDLVRTIGRARGIEATTLYFTTLKNFSLSSEDRRAFFRLATRENNDLLVAASSLALGNRDSAGWKAVLAIAQEKKVPLNDNVLLSALRSEDPVIRGETAWYLAKAYYQARPADSGAVLEAVAKPDSQPDPEQVFGSEMLRRVLGQAPVEDAAWIACLETNPDCHLDSDFFESPLVEYLTPREREALTRRNEAHMPPEVKAKKASIPTSPDKSPPPPAFDLRLVSGLPRGVSGTLFKAGGCSGRIFSTAEIQFRTDGLPRRVSLDEAPIGRGCHLVAETIFLLSMVADRPLPIRSRVVYVALFDPECLVCNEVAELPREEPGPAPDDTLRIRAAVKPPKVVKRAEPTYPEAARRQYQEGVSVYEAIITRTGCVTDLRVVQSSYPLLDISGMEAIARWRYKPAELFGSPVNVYLMVTMTYSLHR